MKEILEGFRKQLESEHQDIRSYSPLTLAYIGDSIFDFFIKYYLVSQGNRSVGEYHSLSKKYVKASNQALILEKIDTILSDEEKRIIKWGRNAKSQTIPKNATRKDYQMATAMECLLGYLLMDQQYERLLELIVVGIKDD